MQKLLDAWKATDKKKKRIIIVVAIVAIILLIYIIAAATGTLKYAESSGINPSDSATIESIEWYDDSNVWLYKVGDTEENWVNVDPHDFNKDDVVFVSKNPEIATITAGTETTGALWYKVEGVSPGETEIYAQSADGLIKTDPLKVEVGGQSSSELENSSSEPLEQSSSESASSANEADVESQIVDSQEPVEEASSDPDDNITVYVTPSGQKYHDDPDCAGKNARAISLSDAKRRGYGPCGTCVG